MAAIQPIDEKPFVVSLHHARSGIISHFRRVADRFRILFFCLSRLQHGVHISTRTFFSRRQILRSSGPAQCFLRCRPSRLHRLRAGIRSGFLNQRHGRFGRRSIPCGYQGRSSLANRVSIILSAARLILPATRIPLFLSKFDRNIHFPAHAAGP